MKGQPRTESEGFAFACLRCGHHWNSLDGKRPTACAHCISAYWDKERKRPVRPKTPTEPTKADRFGDLGSPRFHGG